MHGDMYEEEETNNLKQHQAYKCYLYVFGVTHSNLNGILPPRRFFPTV